MKNFITLKKRCLAKIVASVLAFSFVFTSPVFAAEATTGDGIMTLDEAGISREDAIEALGLTAEEAKQAEFYVLDDPTSITVSEVIDIDHPYDSGYFSFTGRNIGAYRTINGRYMRFTLLWNPYPGDGSEACQVYLYPYDQLAIWQYLFTLASPVSTIDSNYRQVTSEWLDVTYGLDYHFIYDSYTNHGGGYTIEHRCTMRVIIAVV